jgi:molybdopterin-guanine dinucleotide biosynthesis protein A
MTPDRADISGLVLAGGLGRRMGGADKGLLPLPHPPHWPLARYALERLRPQVGALMVSANRHLSMYADWGVPVWPDEPAWAHAGPLAGVQTALAHCSTPWLLTVPCDAPNFPEDLAERLAEGAQQALSPAAVAWSQGQPHPVFCLLHRSVRPKLESFLGQGGRKVRDWTASLGAARVDFDRPGLDLDAFINANTPEDLESLQGLPKPRGQ